MPRPNTNRYFDLGDGVTRVVTIRGDVFLIDTADRIITEKFCWSQDHGYARAVTRTRDGLKTIYLHRLLCLCSKNKPHVDHINGNPLDCRRINLRPCNRSENLQNQKLRADNATRFKGVGLHSQTNRFRARVKVGGKETYIGLFDTPEKAAAAAILYRQQLHKEFARHA